MIYCKEMTKNALIDHHVSWFFPP